MHYENMVELMKKFVWHLGSNLARMLMNLSSDETICSSSSIGNHSQ